MKGLYGREEVRDPSCRLRLGVHCLLLLVVLLLLIDGAGTVPRPGCKGSSWAGDNAILGNASTSSRGSSSSHRGRNRIVMPLGQFRSHAGRCPGTWSSGREARRGGAGSGVLVGEIWGRQRAGVRVVIRVLLPCHCQRALELVVVGSGEVLVVRMRMRMRVRVDVGVGLGVAMSAAAVVLRGAGGRHGGRPVTCNLGVGRAGRTQVAHSSWGPRTADSG